MNVRKVSPKTSKWFRRKAKEEGYMGNARPSVWRLMEAIANGEYELIRTAKHKAKTNK